METQADFLTVKEASEVLGISPNGVRDRIRRGLLPARKSGKGWLVSAGDVMEAEGVSPALARYLCQFLAASLAERIPKIIERQAVELAMRRIDGANGREAAAREELGRLKGLLEATNAEVTRLGGDVGALVGELGRTTARVAGES